MILEKLGMSPGLYCLNESQRADSVRLFRANYKEQEVSLGGDCFEAKGRKKLTNNKKKRVTLMYLVDFDVYNLKLTQKTVSHSNGYSLLLI